MNAKESKQRSGRWACVTSNAWLDSVKRPHSQREIRVRMWDWEMLSKKKKNTKKNQSDYGEGGSRDIQSMRLKATGMQIDHTGSSFNLNIFIQVLEQDKEMPWRFTQFVFL